MAGRDLVFDIFATDRASAVFSRVGAESEALAGKIDKAGGVMNFALLGAGAAAVGFGFKAVQMAADFQTSLTRLGTTAGESTANLQMVGDGILKMAGQVGYSANQLVDAMYEVESGGFHGAAGLSVLKAAAQGARVENANVTDVAHALTGALNDYVGTNLTAVEATNAMTAAVGSGMMRFQDLAEALPKIGARAAAAHVSFEELLAGVGTMTKDGLPAAVAATYLGQTIGQLAAPTAKAQKEMQGLGINATELAATITSGSGHGLGDAIKMLYDGIQNHLVAGGLVSVDTFKKMASSTTDFQQVLAKLPPAIQTQIQALAVSTGGVKAFQGVLMLGGQHAQQYADTLGNVTAQVQKGGDQVAGFAETQKNFNSQLRDAEAAAGAFAIKMGQSLLPIATDTAQVFKGFFQLLSDNQPIVMGLVTGLAAGATAFAALKIVTMAWTALQLAGDVMASVGAFVALIPEVRSAADMFALLDMATVSNPIGLIAGAVAVAVGAFALFNSKSAETKQKAQEQKAAIDALSSSYNGLSSSIDDATRKTAFDKLSKAGAIDNAEALGVGSGVVTSAALGDASALRQVSDAANTAIATYNNFLKSADGVAYSEGQASDEVRANAEQLRLARNAGDLLNATIKQNSADWAQNAKDNRQAAWASKQMADTLQGLGLTAMDTSVLLSGPMAQSTDDVVKQIQKLGPNFHASSDQIQGILKAEMIPGVDTQLTQLTSIIQHDLNNTSTTMAQAGHDIGINFVAGMQGGIQGMTGNITRAAQALSQAALDASGGHLQIQSPSRKTMEFGRYFAEGLSIGISSGIPGARTAATNLSAGALGGLNATTAVNAMNAKSAKKADLAEAIQMAFQNVRLKLDTQTNTLRVV